MSRASQGWGALYDLIYNPYFETTLYDMGIQPYTMFGIALDYLLEPQPAVLKKFKAELKVASSLLI